MLDQQFMIGLLKNMIKSKEFKCSVIANENATCQLLKVLMMKCGYNKLLMSIVTLIVTEMNEKKQQNNLHMIIMNYINKYGKCFFIISILIINLNIF